MIFNTPIAYLYQNDASNQLNLKGWLYTVFNFCSIFNEEATFSWRFGMGGIIFFVNLRDEAPFY